ncbi:MAG: hypothetical protein HS117_14845 [Verrucomicrobiaceae bacterium]|nr:hypothetical protein [Verrucomicrobiaceae bacterium]
MIKTIQFIVLVPAVFMTSILLSGCVVGEFVNYVSHAGSGHFERLNKQRILERSAKDWCLAIRANQIVPVYPLDEDVQVGDVMIVDTPVSQLKKKWNSKGYLPIEHRYGRFQPTGYSKYYTAGQYGVTKDSMLPHLWQSPRNPEEWHSNPSALPMPIPPKKDGESDADYNKRKKETIDRALTTNWPLAPRAAFPVIGFNIRRGESFNGALPLKGVPIMLGALGARSVTGSIALTDVFTYGIDEPSIRDDLFNWLEKSVATKDYLTAYLARPTDPDYGKRKIFLRVITRVYLVRSVDVSLVNQDSSAWKLSAGDPKTVQENVAFEKKDSDLLTQLNLGLLQHSLDLGDDASKDPNSIALRESAVRIAEERQAMKDQFGGFVVPGGTVALTAATQNSISMRETFTRPIVVGYHALEFEVVHHPETGGVYVKHERPESTFARLDD